MGGAARAMTQRRMLRESPLGCAATPTCLDVDEDPIGLRLSQRLLVTCTQDLVPTQRRYAFHVGDPRANDDLVSQ